MKMEWEQFKKADSFNFGKTITVTLGATSETTLSSASVELKGGASASAKLGGGVPVGRLPDDPQTRRQSGIGTEKEV